MAIETSLLRVGTDQRELIINYALHMKRNGRSQQTTERDIRVLTLLSKSADLKSPDQVKAVLATLNWKNTTKKMTAYVLKAFYKHLKIPYEMPTYKTTRELPFIPTEEEIDLLIASGDPTTASRLQLLKETGARIGRLDTLEWTHIYTQRKTIYITGEKGSNSRILPLSDKAISMINHVKRKGNYVFTTKAKGFRKTFENLRKRIAKQASNPRLKKIPLSHFPPLERTH